MSTSTTDLPKMEYVRFGNTGLKVSSCGEHSILIMHNEICKYLGIKNLLGVYVLW